MSHARPKQQQHGGGTFDSLIMKPILFVSPTKSRFLQCTFLYTVRMQIHHSKFVGAVPFAVNTDIRPEWQADRDAPPSLQLCLSRLCTLALTSCPHAKTQSLSACSHLSTISPCTTAVVSTLSLLWVCFFPRQCVLCKHCNPFANVQACCTREPPKVLYQPS